jgi:hypothetical protein
LKALRSYRERLRYLLDRVFAREFSGQLLFFLILVVAVTLLGMSAVFFGLFDPENADVHGIPTKIDGGFWDSMWWSLNNVLNLRGFQRMYGASWPILLYALLLSIMGLAVFGVLVSLINNTMRQRIESLRAGETPVWERRHILILGWNNKIVTVLQQIARLAPGSRIVILAPREIKKMESRLRIAGIPHEPLTVILRTGVPSNLRELDRVAVDRAASVIILSTDGDDQDSIKTLVLLAGKEDWPAEPPTLTCEIALEENYELAQIAARDRVQIISSSRVISKVIVQTIRNPGLAAVYRELFSIRGNGLLVKHAPEHADRTLGELAYGYQDAIPLGVAWEQTVGDSVRLAAGLNPGSDYDLLEEEQLVLLAPREQISYRAPACEYESSIYREGGRQPHVPGRLLLIGWNDMLYDILKELNAHALSGTSILVLSGVEPDEARSRIDNKIGLMLNNLNLEFRKGDGADAATYERVELKGFESIVILADDSWGQDDADTHTLRVLLRLSSLRQAHERRAHTTVELLDGANRDLLAGLEVDDVVVSPDIVSSQAAQVSRESILGPIYAELLSAGGVEISLRPASDYVELDVDCRFDDLTYAAQQKMEIALGLTLADGGRVLLNPTREESWRLGEDDHVVVLAQQVYR